MCFRNWLVTELKKEIQKKTPEFSCFPDKSHNIQLWSHGPVHAALLAQQPCSLLAQLQPRKALKSCTVGKVLSHAGVP